MKNTTDKYVVCYFDLRKYAYIDQNYAVSEQILFLEAFHKTIEENIHEIGGNLYHINSDTAIYYIPYQKGLVDSLLTIKRSVDNYFSNMGFPCELHISCSCGPIEFGTITLNRNSHNNIFGKVMNDLQKTITLSESEYGRNAFNRILLHESAGDDLEPEKILETLEIQNTRFYSLK